MVRDAAVLNYAILDKIHVILEKIAVTSMSSSDQLYQKAIEGFLTSLDRLEAAQTRQSPCSDPNSPQLPESETPPSTQPAALLNDRENQMLEDAMADIEQMMQQSQDS